MVNSSQGGGTKDTWVLDDEPDREWSSLMLAAAPPTTSTGSPATWSGPRTWRACSTSAYRMALDAASDSGADQRVGIAVATAGCGRLLRARRRGRPRTVIEFLAFAPGESVDRIRNCFETARHNARSVRTALTAEMWEAINGAWLELQRYEPRPMTGEESPRFLDWVKSASLLLRRPRLRAPCCATTPTDFSRLGFYIERADNTARMLDVKYHVLLPPNEKVGGGIDYYQWTAILRAVSALTAYHWVYTQNLRPWLVADLLILRRDAALACGLLRRRSSRHLDDISPALWRHRRSPASWREQPSGRLTNREDRRDLPATDCTSSCRSSSLRTTGSGRPSAEPVSVLSRCASASPTRRVYRLRRHRRKSAIQILRLTPRGHDGQTS